MIISAALSEEKLANVYGGADFEYYANRINGLLRSCERGEVMREYLALYYLDLKAEIMGDGELSRNDRHYCLDYLDIRLGSKIK